MRKRILCAVAMLAMSGSVSLGQSGVQGAPPLTVIRAGTLIDGVSEAPRKNQLIFVHGERIEKVADASAAIPAEAKVIDLSNATVLPGLIDAHTHIFLWGEDPAKGGYDVNILKAGIAPRRIGGPRRAGAGFYYASGCGDGRRGIRRHRNQAGDRRGNDSRAENFRSHPGDIEYGRIQSGRVCAGTGNAQGRAACGWAGRSEEGGAATTGAWRGLDQGVHDAPVVGGQARKPGFAADTDRGRVEGDRRRDAWMAEESGVSRVQRNRTAAGLGWRMRLDRARA